MSGGGYGGGGYGMNNNFAGGYGTRPNDMRIPPQGGDWMVPSGSPLPQAPKITNAAQGGDWRVPSGYPMPQRPAPYSVQEPMPSFTGQTKPYSPPGFGAQDPQQNPQVNSLAQQSNANMNLWANPMNLSQAQLGGSFNPIGSPGGGFFQGQNYVPNVGNFRNGLDVLARFGQGWSGQPLQRGPFIS